jgi:hypothetical protein
MRNIADRQIMKDGLTDSDFTRAMHSSSVPLTLGLAGLSKPMWLSLIWRKVKPFCCAAIASSMMPSDAGTPPATVQSAPVPAHVVHSRTLRRFMPSSRVLIVLSPVGNLTFAETRPKQATIYSRIRPHACFMELLFETAHERSGGTE